VAAISASAVAIDIGQAAIAIAIAIPIAIVVRGRIAAIVLAREGAVGPERVK
jgi:hypothetical protein